MVRRTLLLGLLAMGLFGGFSGCAFFHELQPHRLHRLNRQPAPALDPEFTQQPSVASDSRLA